MNIALLPFEGEVFKHDLRTPRGRFISQMAHTSGGETTVFHLLLRSRRAGDDIANLNNILESQTMFVKARAKDSSVRIENLNSLPNDD